MTSDQKQSDVIEEIANDDLPTPVPEGRDPEYSCAHVWQHHQGTLFGRPYDYWDCKCGIVLDRPIDE